MEDKRGNIGWGSQKVVKIHPDSPEMVRAEFRRKLSNEQIKSAYYYNKLIRLFFPKIIPKVYETGNDGESYIHAERAERDSDHIKMTYGVREAFEGMDDRALTEKEWKELENMIEDRRNVPEVKAFLKLASHYGFRLDNSGQNFTLLNRKIQYLDADCAWSYPERNPDFPYLNFDENLLSKAIEENLSHEDKKQAYAYLERIKALLRTEKENLQAKKNSKKAE